MGGILINKYYDYPGEDRYDEEYIERIIYCPRGTNGVMLPNNLDAKAYEKYVGERCGEVKTYNIKDLKNKN